MSQVVDSTSTLDLPHPSQRATLAGSPPARRLDPVRILCHFLAEVPIIVIGIRSLTTGWRATSDDAVVAWRAWDVLTAHPTLLGSPTHTTGLGHQAFAPGPALSWLLAIPVHLDPHQGTLWGSTLVVLAAVAIAVEGGWAAGSRWGAIGAAATVLILMTSETAILMNLPWSPWQGALWLTAAISTAWATSTGRWKWWPACVVAASIAAQAHVVFAPTAVGVCIVSPFLALFVKGRIDDPGGKAHCRPTGRPWRSLMVGTALGLILWTPTTIDALSNKPGNVTLLWRSSQTHGGHVGLTKALQGLGAATWPPFAWTKRLPTMGSRAFISIFHTTFSGGSWRGVVTILVLLIVGICCVILRRGVVARLIGLAIVASLGAILTIARTPSSDEFELVYLGVLFWPVGLTAVWAIAAGFTATIRHFFAAIVDNTTLRTTNFLAISVAVASMSILSLSVTIVDVRSVPNFVSVQGGPEIGVLADRASAAVSKVAPSGSFELLMTGTSSIDRSSAAYPAIAYELIAMGRQVRLPFTYAVGADAARSSSNGLPIVTVDIGSNHPTAVLSHARSS